MHTPEMQKRRSSASRQEVLVVQEVEPCQKNGFHDHVNYVNTNYG